MQLFNSLSFLPLILNMQLVSVDDDLLCELDALDASGLSLLHYCCMYNLTVLVLVLLNRCVPVRNIILRSISHYFIASCTYMYISERYYMCVGALDKRR